MQADIAAGRRLTVVTGADARFFRTLHQFLESARRWRVDQEHSILAYDLGLEPAQADCLRHRHPRVEWRAFPFARYPDFVGRTRHVTEASPPRHVLGHYAWKPALIADTLEERGGLVLWLDAGTLLRGSLDPVVAAVSRDGTYVPYSGSGILSEYAHPDTRRLLGADDAMLARRCRGGGLCAFDAEHAVARRIVADWKRHALDEACIAPPGAHHHNHRYDQAILSILLYQAEARDGLRLTEDEQNVSSADPIRFCLVRNKVGNRVPLWLDPLVRAWFEASAAADVAVHRVRRAWRGRHDG